MGSNLIVTARHFRWPCAIFADTGVFKIRITILKSMQYVTFLWDFSQITSNHQSNTKNNIEKYDFFKYEIYQVPWKSMEFHGTFWGKIKRSMEFHGTREYGKSSMEFHGTLDLDKIPWNSMEPQVLFKCCSKSSMELWRKFHGTFWSKSVSMSIKKRFQMIFWYVMSNARNAYGIMQILIIKHQLVEEITKRYRVFINLRKLIHPAQFNIIFIKLSKLKFHGILSHF